MKFSEIAAAVQAAGEEREDAEVKRWIAEAYAELDPNRVRSQPEEREDADA